MKLNNVLKLCVVVFAILAIGAKRYFNEKQEPLNNKATEGAYVLYCDDKQEWNDSANIDNLVFDAEKKTVRFKTEAEKVQMLIPSKVSILYQSAQGYVKSRGYDEVTLMRMSVFLTQGNDAQKALCQSVLDFTDKVTKEGYFTRKAQAEACTKISDLNAISLNYSNFDTDDPKITLAQVEQAE